MATKKKVKKEEEKEPKKTAKPKTSLKEVKQTAQKAEIKAIITDANGNETEITKPFGDDIVVMENMANVGFSYGETINTGNYSSAKYQVSLHVPCYIEDIKKYFKGARKKVMEWSEEIKSEIESQI